MGLVFKAHRLVYLGFRVSGFGFPPCTRPFCGSFRLINVRCGPLDLFVGEYRSTSLIRNNPPLGPYRRPMPRALWWS